jgi:hypothetical protein
MVSGEVVMGLFKVGVVREVRERWISEAKELKSSTRDVEMAL